MFALAGLTIGLIIFLSLFGLTFIVLSVIGLWKIFQKAGKEGWEAIIPFYNQWVLVEITGLKQWFFYIMIGTTIVGILGIGYLQSLARIAALGATFFANYNLAKKFGKDPVGYGIGLTIVPFIFYLILGLGKDNVYSNVYVSPYGPIADNEQGNNNSNNQNTNQNNSTTNETSETSKFCKNCGAPIGDEKFCTKCGTQLH